MIKLNGQEIKFDSLPNNETLIKNNQLKHLEDTYNVRCDNLVEFKYENDSDLIKLMFVKKYLDSINYSNVKIDLLIYYMPYSRMDRDEGEALFTLKYISDFINSLNFTSIKIIEPHSDVTSALVNKSISNFPSIKIFNNVLNIVNFNKEKDYVYFADGGAEKRYSKMIDSGFNTLIGFKKRDFKTGTITHLQVIGDMINKDCKVIILDDLSSFGGTFILGSERLKEMGAKEIYLVIGHCEDNIFEGKIFNTDLINKVFTTNSMFTDKTKWLREKWIQENRISIYEINDLI